jgi:hypothetical protein
MAPFFFGFRPIYYSCIPSHDPSIVFCFPSSLSSDSISFCYWAWGCGEVVCLSSGARLGLQCHRGLVCDAVRRMTPRGPLTRVHETCDWMSQAGFWKDHPKSRLRSSPADSTSGISSIGSSIISYSKGIPLADSASTSAPFLPLAAVDPAPRHNPRPP